MVLGYAPQAALKGTAPQQVASDLPNVSTPAESPRIEKLDAVRGIASLMVVVGHSLGSIGIPQAWGWVSPWPLLVLWDGQAAVLLFFFLSGYVLSIPYVAARPPSLRRFLIRRFFRIWPAYAAMLFVSLGVYSLIGRASYPPAGNSLLLPDFSPDFPSLLQNFLVMGSLFAINPPSWTLFVEMRVGLIFPLLMTLLLAPRPHFILKFLALFAACYVLSRFEKPEHSWGAIGEAIGSTARWTYLFFLGAAVRRFQPQLATLFARFTPAAILMLIAVSVSLIAYRHAPADLPLQNIVRQVGMLTIFSLIAVSAYADRLLARRSLLVLGALSYSIYLVHWPILFGVISLRPPGMPDWSVVALVPALSVAFGYVLNRSIEMPGIRIGKWANGGGVARRFELTSGGFTSSR